MSTQKQNSLPSSVSDRVARLRGPLAKMHLTTAEHFDGPGPNSELDLLALNCLQRSLSLAADFTLRVEERNAAAATPLIRVQIANIMRLYACGLVEDPARAAAHLLADKPLGELVNRTGEKLIEAHLRRQLTREKPWVSDILDVTSAQVHGPPPPIAATAKVSVADPGWPEAQMVEVVDAFIASTEGLLGICAIWLATRAKPSEP